MNRLLICTVGGSSEPIIAAIKHWQPLRVIFIHTLQSKASIVEQIQPTVRSEGIDLDAGRFDLFEIPNEQDFQNCLEMLASLTQRVEAWSARGSDYEVIVDFTGGTKCMSAALVLQASRWPCLFSYVGGNERTKDGVGIVVSGQEKIIHHSNPWEALSRQAISDFIVLFDQHAFKAAAELAERVKKKVSLARQREFAALENLAKGFGAWDRFDHKAARSAFDTVAKSANDLRSPVVFGEERGSLLLAAIDRAVTHLKGLSAADKPSLHHVVDLLANAKRRADEGRFDDAVARLYRAIEALAQVALKERHQISNTSKVPIDGLPEPLRAKKQNDRPEDGTVKLGLQDDYELLDSLGDPMGSKFKNLGLSGDKSVLNTRNNSILAHGFERVSKDVFDKLWKDALDLAGMKEDDMPSLPRLDAKSHS